jgi:hypothetical protein
VSLLCLSLTLVAAPTVAQEARPTAAQAAYRNAQEAMGKGNWHEAKAILIDLWKKSQTFDVAASLGEVEYHLGHHDRAARYTAFALAHLPPKEKGATAQRIQAAFDELRPRVGTISIAVNEDAAEVVVDNEPIGRAPLSEPIFVNPGAHEIEARMQGRRVTKSVVVEAGTDVAVSLDLPDPVATSPLPPPVSVDGQGIAPDRPSTLAERPSSAPLYVLGALAAAGLGTGVVFHLVANANDDEFERLLKKYGDQGCAPPAAVPLRDCEAAKDEASEYDRNRTISTVSFVAGGAALLGAIGYYWLVMRGQNELGATERARLRLEADVQTHGGAFWLTGNF